MSLSDEESGPQRMVTVKIPEEVVAEAKARWAELAGHPAALGRARRYSATCAIRAAARVGLAALKSEGNG